MAQAAIYTGPTNNSSSRQRSFDQVYDQLTKDWPFPVLPSPSPYAHDEDVNREIAELHLHPTLEALLHCLNNDLPSAHFLCRHMQNKPAYEGMYIHGLLHRIEGDYRNAEAWYADVAESECFQSVWSDCGGLEGATTFIRDVEQLRKEKSGDLATLEQQSRREIKALMQWCTKKFGTAKVADGTEAWVEPPEEVRAIASKMLVGGEGWRQF